MKVHTERLLNSRLLQDFVRESGGSWSPGDWLGLLLKPNWNGFGSVSEARVSKLVMDNRDWWLKGKNSLSPERRTDARSGAPTRKKRSRPSRKAK
jgi:hypothetical protein